ncbi:FliG C-terminal domain protein [Halobacteriovorax sp. BALOs_7]|uniref:FliG C-terminal domain-containing protein n=1 Tax=Halobacteriovorax sp. BALOs_7 TaxID=2109558 RepID=UPI000EA3A131|nr:FliG C-terminal domain-containing protein [Halobacteriovorax sp. BALOs_7]AYF43650.1 FliG C-terminal domain protein [Halobacteriovorax sp. BALOs_7]
MKLWSSFDQDYILKRLTSLYEEGVTINFWQSNDDVREDYQAKFTGVTSEKCSIKLTAETAPLYTRIAPLSPIFFHYPAGDLIFKKDIFKLENGGISFKTPSEIRCRDRRSVERFNYKYPDYKNISYTLEDSEEIINDIIIDISLRGLAFVIDAKKKDKYQLGTKIYIRSITDQELPTKHEAKVASVNRYHVKGEGLQNHLLRIGLEFTQTLESVTYDSIGSLVKKRQNKLKGFDTKFFNGLNPDDYEKQLAVIYSKNPQLAANINESVEDIDRLRYMTIDMKREFFLEFSLDLMACALRMSSKELINELLSEVTDGVREEFLEKYDQPKPASAINKAQDELRKFIRDKEKDGSFVLSPKSFVKYV